jgi:hypothetical protein
LEGSLSQSQRYNHSRSVRPGELGAAVQILSNVIEVVVDEEADGPVDSHRSSAGLAEIGEAERRHQVEISGTGLLYVVVNVRM